MWIDFFYQSKRYRRSLELEATKANTKLAQTKIIPEIVYKLNQGTFFELEEKKALYGLYLNYIKGQVKQQLDRIEFVDKPN